MGSTRRNTMRLSTCSLSRKTRPTRCSSAMACSISSSTTARILCEFTQRACASRLRILCLSSIGVPGSNLSLSTGRPTVRWLEGAVIKDPTHDRSDLGYMINHAMFQRNGRSGYVLKPLALRSQDKSLLSKQTRHYLDITVRIN